MLMNIDLEKIAKEDGKCIEDTKRAFREAIKLAKREQDDAPLDAVVMRIVDLRKTLGCTLNKAVILWDAQADTGFQNPKPRKCKVCGKATATSSYYFCPSHLSQNGVRESTHDDFMRHGNA